MGQPYIIMEASLLKRVFARTRMLKPEFVRSTIHAPSIESFHVRSGPQGKLKLSIRYSLRSCSQRVWHSFGRPLRTESLGGPCLLATCTEPWYRLSVPEGTCKAHLVPLPLLPRDTGSRFLRRHSFLRLTKPTFEPWQPRRSSYLVLPH